MAFLSSGAPPESTRPLARRNWAQLLGEHIRRMGRVDDPAYVARGQNFLTDAYEDICHWFHHYVFDAQTPPELKLTIPEEEYTFYTKGFVQVPVCPVAPCNGIIGVGTTWLDDNVPTGVPINIGQGGLLGDKWFLVDTITSNTAMTISNPNGIDLAPTPKSPYAILLIDPNLNPALGFSPATLVIPPGQTRVRLPDDLYIVFQPHLLDPGELTYYDEGTVTITEVPAPGGNARRVVGDGTAWKFEDLLNGLPIEIPTNSGRWYTIAYIESDTVLYLTEDFPFKGIVTADYRILRADIVDNDLPIFKGTLTYNEAHRHFADFPTLDDKPGQPKQCTRYENDLYFERPADKAYLLNILYYRHPKAPNFGTSPEFADATFPEVDRVWDNHLIEHSCALAHAALFRPDLAKTHEDAFQAFAEQMPQLRTVYGSLRQGPERPTRTAPHGGEQG